MSSKDHAKTGAILQALIIIISCLTILTTLGTPVAALPDTVTLEDAIANDLTVAKNGTVVFIQASDTATNNTTLIFATATVVENGVPSNNINVDIYDDGQVVFDTKGDGTYVGTFNITDSATGGTTDDGMDVIAIAHGATVTVTVDLDGSQNGQDSITADYELPIVAITSPDQAYISGNYYLAATATDPNFRNVTWQVDSGTHWPTQPQGNNNYIATVETVTLDLDEGIHEITVTARDNATNEAQDWINITVDRSPPEVNIHIAPLFVQDTYRLNVTVSDFNLNDTTVLYRLDMEDWEPLPKIMPEVFAEDIPVSTLEEGQHTIYIQAADLAENVNNTEFVDFWIDRTDAAIDILNDDGLVVRDSFILEADVDDENMGGAPDIKYKVDDGSPIVMSFKVGITYMATINTIQMSEGAHKINVVARDLASNVNESGDLDFIVDRTTPEITITSEKTGYFTTQYTLSATVTDANLDTEKVVYELDDGGALRLEHSTGDTYAKVLDVSKWNEKLYKITIRASDLAGNFKEVSEINITIDRTPPAVSYTLDKTINGYRLEVTLTDPNLDPESVYYSLDGGLKKEFDNIVTKTYSSVISEADFGEGVHNITIYASDFALNERVVSYEEIVADPPPQITGLVAFDERDGKIRLNWTASTVTDLDHYAVYYSELTIFTDVEGMTPVGESTTNTFQLTGLAIGERYYFAVVAIDELGNFNKTVRPVSGTSTETPKVPVLEVTSIEIDNKDPIDGDEVIVTATVKNVGPYDATNLKVRLMVDGEVIATETISALNSGQEQTKDLSWVAYEGDHDIEIVILSGVSPLTTKQYGSKVTVKPHKTTVEPTSFLDQWMIPILVIVAVVVIISLVAVGLRGSKKEEEELIRQEIELGLRPDEHGKIHRPGEGDQKGPEAPKKKEPEVEIPQSPILQQKPPETPPPQAPPQQQPPQAPPQQPPPQQQPPQAPPQQPPPQQQPPQAPPQQPPPQPQQPPKQQWGQ